MNEQRIREIANQASDHAENTVEYFPDTEDGLDYPAKMMKVRDLKFAELMVRECIAQAVKEEERYDSLNGRDCDYCSMAMANFQVVLAKHFGVEE